MSFRTRSGEKEFLDDAFIPAEALKQNLRELHVINARLGGYRASCKGLDQLFLREKPIRTLLDIGFGGGDFIRTLSLHARKKEKPLFIYGVDLKAECLSYATGNLSDLTDKKLIRDDYRNISAGLLSQIDVIHCSLFLHHLSDEEIVALFRFARDNKCMILANDLHRHWLAYYSILFLTRLFSKSYLVRNDAPLSVKRGFRKKELMALLRRAGFSDYSVSWSWAFRYIILARP